MSVAPITWRIVSPPVARDGDSVYLVRERTEFVDEAGVANIRRDEKPKLCRATWLKCPEISGPNKDPINGPLAKADAQEWLDDAFWSYGGDVTAVQYGFEKYGRPLVDIRAGDESFSIWMTSKANEGRGWPVYEE